MNRCTELREQLEDVALGLPATPEFGTHLAECAACAVELERQSALARRLDGAIAAAVRVEPPAQLLAGVADRLSRARSPSRWSAMRPQLALWAALAACALLVAFGVRALERPSAPRSDLSALAAWRSPTDSLLAPGSDVGAPRRPLSQPTSGGTRGS